jgi:predicted NBD/HSP70 family sugar kinase
MQHYSSAHKQMRIRTLMKVIQAIGEGVSNKNEIRERTGLSWGSCSETISLLQDSNLIKALKAEPGNRGKPGRKAKDFAFNNKKFLFTGMEVKAKSVVCSLVNLGMKEIYRKEYKLREKLTNQNAYRQISSVYVGFLVDSGIKSDAILGLSLSLTGAVDPSTKKLIFSSRYDSLKDMDFSQLKEALPGIQYFSVEHDINGQSASVINKNRWKEENYAFVHCGEGVGMAFYNRGIYTGARGFAGEIGHLPYHGQVEPRICPCGKKNCFEAYLSDNGIKELIRDITGVKLQCTEELDNSVVSDPELCNIIGDAVSQMLILISNIMDPGLIIIGGTAINPFIPGIKSLVEQRLREEAWQGGVQRIEWFPPEDINCAFGTILNASGKMIEQFIKDNLI